MTETMNGQGAEVHFAVFENFNFGEPINSIDISNDGIHLAAVSNHTLSLLNLLENKLSKIPLTARKNANAAKFNQDGDSLFITAEKPNVNFVLYDIEKSIAETVFQTTCPVNNISVGKSKSLLATSSSNNIINLWDDRTCRSTLWNKMYGSGVVKLYPRCNCLLAVNDFGISLYDLRKFAFGPHTTYIYPGHYDVNSCIDVSCDESKFFATSVKNTVDLFSTDAATPVLEYINDMDFQKVQLHAGFDKYSSAIFIGNAAGGLDVYDCLKNKFKYEFPQPTCTGPVQHLAVNPVFMSICTTLGNLLHIWKSNENLLPYDDEDTKTDPLETNIVV
ncbi:uncharacterized protein LOC119666996 [Teleopsis dalmanni]|uniref:uncharacterized protein LOC119666996 n=1 Tax=Teleopsis dalmanni TaxID=139649 RepID=UPI0018CE31A7|nr:uncharacterized protein LOC119666996 [Teleopsis dalmanni]